MRELPPNAELSPDDEGVLEAAMPDGGRQLETSRARWRADRGAVTAWLLLAPRLLALCRLQVASPNQALASSQRGRWGLVIL